jgi:hypothetical protein
MSALSALQTALAAEHAAVYVLGALGGRTSRSASPDLYAAVSAAYAAHRARRDQLVRTISGAGGEPVASEAAYRLPTRMDTPEQISRAAREVEHRCARTYAYLVAETTGRQRRWAITALNEAAVRVLVLRGTPEMFPGLDEHTDR